MRFSKRLGFRYTEPPPTLLVIYHDITVAELEQKDKGFVFRYLPAFRELGLSPLPGLATDRGEQQFFTLPTYFAERLPDLRRPEIRDWMKAHGAEALSELKLLAALGTHTITDPFELRLKKAA